MEGILWFFWWNHTAVSCESFLFFSFALVQVTYSSYILSVLTLCGLHCFLCHVEKAPACGGLVGQYRVIPFVSSRFFILPFSGNQCLADQTGGEQIAFCLSSKCRNVGCSWRFWHQVNLQRLMQFLKPWPKFYLGISSSTWEVGGEAEGKMGLWPRTGSQWVAGCPIRNCCSVSTI